LVWRAFTFHPYKELVLAHQNNGHPLFKNPSKPKLYFWGRNSCTNPGYMDGAIFAANTIALEF
jgi:monoamine oxidase